MLKKLKIMLQNISARVFGYIPKAYWYARLYGMKVGEEIGGKDSRESILELNVILRKCGIFPEYGYKALVNSVADVGCGTGLYLPLLENRSHQERVAFDITDTLFDDLSRKFVNWKFVQADCSERKFSIDYSEHFDLVVCIDVILHQIESLKAEYLCRNLFKMLKPNGILLLSPCLAVSWKNPKGHCMLYGRGWVKSWFPKQAYISWVSFRGAYMAIIRK